MARGLLNQLVSSLAILLWISCDTRTRGIDKFVFSSHPPSAGQHNEGTKTKQIEMENLFVSLSIASLIQRVTVIDGDASSRFSSSSFCFVASLLIQSVDSEVIGGRPAVRAGRIVARLSSHLPGCCITITSPPTYYLCPPLWLFVLSDSSLLCL